MPVKRDAEWLRVFVFMERHDGLYSYFERALNTKPLSLSGKGIDGVREL